MKAKKKSLMKMKYLFTNKNMKRKEKKKGSSGRYISHYIS